MTFFYIPVQFSLTGLLSALFCIGDNSAKGLVEIAADKKGGPHLQMTSGLGAAFYHWPFDERHG